MHDLRVAGMVEAFFQISGVGPTLFGRNGEGDPYYTDGEIDFARLVLDGAKSAADLGSPDADRPQGPGLARYQPVDRICDIRGFGCEKVTLRLLPHTKLPSLPRFAAVQRMERKQRLTCLAPKSGFVAA